MSNTYSTHRYVEFIGQALLGRFPLFGILVAYMRLVPSEDYPIAATDGRAIYYNPAWFENVRLQKDNDSAMFILAHEVLHSALGHLWRQEWRNRYRWNIATDLVINQILVDAGLKGPSSLIYFGTTVNGVYMDPAWKGLSEEQIYDRIPDVPDLFPFPLAGDMLDPDQVQDDASGSAGPGSGPEDLRRIWRDRLVKAAHSARGRGTIPAGIERIIEEILHPTKDWRAVLAEFVRPTKYDYEWRRPDRRLLPDLYIPTLSSDAIENLVVAIDTSGSTLDYYDRFVGELEGILRSYPRVNVWIMTCDADVHQVWNADQDSPIPRMLKGGGGTSFVPVFEKIRELEIDPGGVVFLTDGDGEYPEKEPAYPVLWVLTPDHRVDPPWGRVTVLD